MKYLSVKNPQWMDAKHTILNVLVLFEDFTEEVEFTTQADYDMTHGIEIFNRAVAGEFGEIAEYAKPEISVDQAHTTKLAEIVNGSDAAINWVKSQFSQVETEGWARQEAGARIILGDEGNTKNDQAILLLGNEATRAIAQATVTSLADIDGVDPKDFSMRIAAHADNASQAATLIWSEQRFFEKALREAKEAGSADAILAINIKYSLPPAAL